MRVLKPLALLLRRRNGTLEAKQGKEYIARENNKNEKHNERRVPGVEGQNRKKQKNKKKKKQKTKKKKRN